MVRSSALQKLETLWLLGFVSLALFISTPAYGKENHGKVKNGEAEFDTFEIANSDDGNDDTGFELRLTFDQAFEVANAQLSLNNIIARHPSLQGIMAHSRWEGNTLIIDLQDLSFGEKSFVATIQEHINGKKKCKFKLGGKYFPKVAEFRRVLRLWNPKAKSTVTLDKISPAEKMTTSRSISFEFSSAVGKTLFFCSLDGARWSLCVSPTAYSGLKVGPHTFRVRALSRRFRMGPVTVYSWKVIEKSIEQNVTITSTDPNTALNNSSSMRIYFTATSGLTTQCQLDGGALSACTSPVTYTGLGEGTHTVSVVGFSNGVQATSDNYTWVTDRTAPLVQWNETPSSRTKDSTARLSMSANESVTWKCGLNSNTLNDCTSPTEFYGLPEGTHSFQAVATDSAGNNSLPLTFNWMIDLTAPVVTVSNANPSQVLTNSKTMSITFVTSEPSVVSCSLNGTVVREDCASPAAFTGLADGDYEATFVATDSVGNVGVSVSHKWTVDTTAPVLTMTLVSPILPTNQTTATFSISSNDASATVQTFLDGHEVPNTGTGVTVSGLSDGQHTLVAYAMDASGNWSQHSEFTWSVDLTAPVVQLGQINPSDSVTAITSISIDFSASENATFECRMGAGNFSPCQAPFVANDLIDGTHTFSARAADLAGNLSQVVSYEWTISTYVTAQIDLQSPNGSLTNSNSMMFAFSSDKASSFVCEVDGGAPTTCVSPMNLANLSDGSHTFKVSGVNAAGKVGGSDSRTWSVDATAPVIQMTSFNPIEDPTLVTSFSMQFSVSESAATICSFDGGLPTACTGIYSGSNLSVGPHSVTVTSTDAAGNTGVMTRSWTVVEPPPIPPNVMITSIVPSASVTNSTSITLSFMADRSDVSYSCSMDSGIPMPCTSPASYSQLSHGTHTFRIYATGSEGTVGPSVSYSWNIDLQGPTVTFTSSFPLVTSSHTLTASFLLSEQGNAFCSIDNGAYFLCFSPFTMTGLADGNHSLSVYGQDAFGNYGSVATRTWTVDSSGPVVTIDSTLPNWSPTSSNSITLNFSSDESATFYCSVDGGAATACTSPFTATGFTNGPHSISVYGVDAMGTAGSSVSYSWTVDTTPLAITNFSVSNITSTTALVTWNTNIPATSKVMVNGVSTPATTEYVTSHSVLLTGLAKFTFYTVYGISEDRDGRMTTAGPNTFRTLR